MDKKKRSPLFLFTVTALFLSSLLVLKAHCAAKEEITNYLDDDEEEIYESKKDSITPVEAKHHAENVSPLFYLLKKSSARSHFTLSHEFASHTNNIGRLFLNRSSIRMQYDDLFYNSYYLLFDAKAAYNFSYLYVDYPPEVKDRYLLTYGLRQLFIQTNIDNISITLGKQIIVWGEAEASVITDVISPRDLTEFIFIPIEDSRLGQFMLTTDLYTDWGQFSFILNPDAQVNRYARADHEYQFLVSQPSSPPLSTKYIEGGFRWTHTVNSSDISFVLASVIDNDPVLITQGISPQGNIIVSPEYHRYYVVGATRNMSYGNFLLRGEAGSKIYRRLTCSQSIGVTNKKCRVTSLDIAFGTDYSANGVYTIIIELSNIHTLGNNSKILSLRRNESFAFIAFEKKFLHETLDFSYNYIHQLQDTEGMHRLRITYDISNRLRTTVGFDYFTAWKTDSSFGIFKDKNRISISFAYDY